MYCPNCGHLQYCGCKNCEEMNRKKYNPFIPFIWTEEDDGIKCGNCDLEAHCDFWENLGMEISYLLDKNK